MQAKIGAAIALTLAGSCALPAHADPSAGPEVVVVTAQPAGRTALIDRKVYPVSKQVQAQFGSAADVLNTIPSVTVDTDGNVSLRNDANVTILIDGKPSSQFSGSTGGTSLLELPASDIDRIEIMTSPPASVNASGSGGVINIVTKKHLALGLSGLMRASAGDRGRFATGGDFDYNTRQLKASVGLALRRDVRDRLTKDSRVEIASATGAPTWSHERINENIRRLVPVVKAGLEYEIDDGQSLGATFSHRNLAGARHFLQQDDSGPAADAIDSLSDRISHGREWDAYEDGSVSYNWQPGAADLLSLTLDRSTKREDEKYDYVNTYALPPASPTYDTLKLGLYFQEIEFTADYAHSFADGGQVKFGYDLDTNDNYFDNTGADLENGLSVIDPSETNVFRYRNDVHAAYGEAEDTLGSWHVEEGLRYEAGRAHTLLVTGNVPGTNDDAGFFPSVHVERSFDAGWDVLANISRRITRPDPEALNPFVDYQDIHNLRAGNASLLPQDTWLYELGYRHSGNAVNFGTTAYYRFDRNSVTDVEQPVSSDVVLIQKENLPKTHSFGLEFEADGRVTSRLGFSVSANAFHMQIDARQLGALGLQSTTGVNVKAEGDYHVTVRDDFELIFTRTDSRLTPQGTLGATDLLNLGFRHKIDESTTLVATASDLLIGQGLHRVIATPQLQDNYLRLQAGRIFFIGLVYGFGAPLNKKADEMDYEQ